MSPQSQPGSPLGRPDEFSNAALLPCNNPEADLDTARAVLKEASTADRLSLDWQAQNTVSPVLSYAGGDSAMVLMEVTQQGCKWR